MKIHLLTYFEITDSEAGSTMIETKEQQKLKEAVIDHRRNNMQPLVGHPTDGEECGL